MTHPAVGTDAPDFTATIDDGSALTLSSLRGKPVVMFFYPKDDTSGCTKEACGFQDAMPRLKTSAHVIGVSPDPVKSHVKFKEKYGLKYPLVADVDHAVCEAYGTWGEKSMYGRKYFGVLRTTFVIDAKGRIAHVFEKVKPEGHAAEVEAVLASLK